MKTGKRFGYLGLSLLAFIAAIAVQLVAQIIVILPSSIMVGFQVGMQGITDVETINQMTLEATEKVVPVALLVSHLAMLLTFALWYKFGCGKPSLKKLDAKKVFSPKHLAAFLLIGVGMCYFTNFALGLIYPIIPESIVEAYETMMENAQMGESAIAIFAAVFIAPIGEELIFRGVVFYYAKKAVTGMSNKTVAFWIANCVQALFFGVMHMNVLQGTYAFMLGLVLGYLAYRFQSVLPAILGHFLFNSVSTFTTEAVTSLLPESNTVYAIIAGISLVITIAGLLMTKPAKEQLVVE